MSVYVIDTLTDETPNYSQEVDLDGVTYTLQFRWCERSKFWYLTVLTPGGEVLQGSTRLVVNWPLLRNCIHPLRPPGELMAVTRTDADPGLIELGARVVLMYIDKATVFPEPVGTVRAV